MGERVDTRGRVYSHEQHETSLRDACTTCLHGQLSWACHLATPLCALDHPIGLSRGRVLPVLAIARAAANSSMTQAPSTPTLKNAAHTPLQGQRQQLQKHRAHSAQRHTTHQHQDTRSKALKHNPAAAAIPGSNAQLLAHSIYHSSSPSSIKRQGQMPLIC
jgi:hypothetical protein